MVLKKVLCSQDLGDSYWLCFRDLNLLENLVVVWDTFVVMLNQDGIFLSYTNDKLVWNYNKGGGMVNAKLAYNILMEDGMEKLSSLWTPILWFGQMPLKIKSFSWLCLNRKI